MRFPEASHMADDGGEAPVWARRSGRGGSGGGNPLFALIFALLALVGVLTIALAIMDKSFAAGGARMDRWIAPVISQVKGMTGKAGDKAEEAAADAKDAAGDAAAAAGSAAEEAGDKAEAAGDSAEDAAKK